MDTKPDIRQLILDMFREAPGTEEASVTFAVNDAGDPEIQTAFGIITLHDNGMYSFDAN